MARTPLLRALRRLAEEHDTAARLGLPPAELRGRRLEEAASISRGTFLKRAATGAAVVAAGPVLAQRANAATAPRIAIVGGGIAGLSAALTLADKGFASTIYEASTERIGGRMHTDRSGYFANGQISEFCGELIDTNHKTILQLAQRFKLPTVDLLGAQPNGTTDTLFFSGYYSVDQADKDFQPIHKTLADQVQATSYPTTYNTHTDAGIFFDQMTVFDWIENYVPGGHGSRMGRLLDVAYNEEYGAETKAQAALNLMYLAGFNASPGNFAIFGKSDERYHIVGGNERLPEAIANYVGRQNIRMGWSMQSIQSNADGTVTLRFSTPGKPQTVAADHVILCLPFAVLRTLDYSRAGFDTRKQTAIAQLGAGRNSKLQLQFATRFWTTQGPWGRSNGNLFTDAGFQNTWEVTRGQDGTTGILVDYGGGDYAGSFSPSTPYSNAGTNAQVATYAQAWLKQLAAVFPGIESQWTGKATLSTPFLDPLLNCSYSYWKPGQYVGFSGYEGVAQGNVHFAGEHCSVNFQGYMEGGASEGVRAANEVLALLK
jgi:monoamine oxidase